MIEKTFKVNDYITLKLEDGKTNIYVNDVYFNHCKFLLIDIPINEINELDEIESIDEMAQRLDKSLEEGRSSITIPGETAFWGHCSVRHEAGAT